MAARRASTLVLASFLVGCQTAAQPASEAEKDQAILALIECLHDQARKLDDGRSDATSVANAIVPGCGRYFVTVDRVTQRHMSLHQQALLARDSQYRYLQLATRAVMDMRTKR